MTVGKRVEELLQYFLNKKYCKNQQEFCLRLGINYKNFTKITRNEINLIIDSENYEKLITNNINIYWLLTGEGNMFTDTEVGKEDKQSEVQKDKKIQELEKQLEKLTNLIEKKDSKIDGLKKEIETLDNIIAYFDNDTQVSEKYSRVLEHIFKLRSKLT